MTEEYQVVVEKVVKGKHGFYAVAKLSSLGSVTFALNKKTWAEDTLPGQGVFVVVSDLIKKRSGWRAQKARYLRPEDKPQQRSIKERKQKGATQR